VQGAATPTPANKMHFHQIAIKLLAQCSSTGVPRNPRIPQNM